MYSCIEFYCVASHRGVAELLYHFEIHPTLTEPWSAEDQIWDESLMQPSKAPGTELFLNFEIGQILGGN